MNPLTPYRADYSERLSGLLNPVVSESVQDLIVQSKLDNFALWVYLKEFDCCVCFPHKNGGCSFRWQIIKIKGWQFISSRSLHVMQNFYSDGHGPFHPKEAEYLYPHVPHYLAVRHPVDRFRSVWQNKCRDQMGPPVEVYGMTPDELMDYIEVVEDRHWRRQSENLTGITQPVLVAELLQMIGAEKHINKTERQDSDPDMPIDRILNYYADDLRIWEDACSRTNTDVGTVARQ